MTSCRDVTQSASMRTIWMQTNKTKEKEEIEKVSLASGTVVVNLTHFPKSQGLNPASGTRERENEGKRKIYITIKMKVESSLNQRLN